MEFLLIRQVRSSEYTLGRLYVRQFSVTPQYGTIYYPHFLCDTLEPTAQLGERREDKRGECHPRGEHDEVTYSSRFKQWLPLLFDMPDFSGIRIYAGNSMEYTESCILVEDNYMPVRLTTRAHDSSKSSAACAHGSRRWS